MGILEIIILVFAGFFFFKGYRQGLIFSFFKVLAYFLGIIIAMNFSSLLSSHLFNEPDSMLARIFPLLSYGILFFAVVMLVNLLGKWIQNTFSIPLIGTANRIAGGLLYTLVFGFIASTFLWIGSKMGMLHQHPNTTSVIIKYTEPIAPFVFENVGVVLPFVKNAFNDLNNFFDQLKTQVQ